MTQYDIAVLKAGGLMKQKEPDLFSLRLRIVGGRVDADKLRKLAELSEKYGTGHIHLTTRQGAEIPNVHFKNVEQLRAELGQVNLELGGCGARVRTITACQGGICSSGLIDPQALAVRIDKAVFGRSGLPHKFKIGITGCPNACIKPQENDLGIMGIVRKAFHENLCTLCGLCVHACPVPGTLQVIGNRLVYNPETCVYCGSCIAACPSDAWVKTGVSYALFAGGKIGKRPKLGERLPTKVNNDDHLLQLITKTIDWYAANGKKGERFGETIDRLGLCTLADYLDSPGNCNICQNGSNDTCMCS